MPLPLLELPLQNSTDEVDEEILEIFVEEIEEDVLPSIVENFNILKGNSTDKDALQTIRRAFHTMKGSGRLVGASVLGELGWHLEELLNKVLEGSVSFNQNVIGLVEQIEGITPQLIKEFQNGQEPDYATRLLISQAAHLTETKGKELGEFAGDGSSDEAQIEAITATPSELNSLEDQPLPVPNLPDTIVDDEILLNIFREESKGHLNTLKRFLIVCHQDPPGLMQEEVVRALHTLHGSSMSIGFGDMAELATVMENYSKAALEKGFLLDKKEINLFIESGKLLDHMVAHIAHFSAHKQLNQQLKLWHEAIAELPSDEASIVIEPETNLDGNNEAIDEFMEIFLEEAEEILETCQTLLVSWQAAPSSMPLLKELQRELHTLKGGARMVGITEMGDLSHHLESILTRIVEGQEKTNPTLQTIVQESVDVLASMLEAVRNQEALSEPSDPIQQIDQALGDDRAPKRPVKSKYQTTKSDFPAPSKAEIHKTEPSPAPSLPDNKAADPEERVRVRSTLIDKLTNLAEEQAISRAHMEQQQEESKTNLQEMAQTIMRLRDQLRRLEIETEAQIMSHFGDQTTHSSNIEHEDFDPLEMDRFSGMQQLARSLMESVTDLQNIEENLQNINRYSDALLLQQGRVGTELQDSIMHTRMVPFTQISPRLQRIARLTAKELNKKIEFIINDNNMEFERTVLNRVVAPLEHMLRNAIGHGIEDAEIREKTNKSETALVTIDLTQEGAEIIIKVSDDGAGLKIDAIRKKAQERGMLKGGDKISQQDLMQFILEPAFSTATTVTQVSGRGVGMDIVNNEIKQLSGSLQIDSVQGKGSSFEIRLPLSLTISQALLIHVGEETLAVPLHNVDAVIRVPREQVLPTLEQPEHHYMYMNKDYRVIHLGDLLGFGRLSSNDSQLLPMLLVSAGEQRLALIVDMIEGSREVVVKAVGPQLSSIRWLAGATILGDGRVVIILDILNLLRSNAADEVVIIEEEETEIETNKKTIMVVDDSITVRKVTARFLQRQGMEVITAKDGLDAIGQLQDRIPDLMLLDVEMPRMDGFELAGKVRNTPEWADIPIIMITSRTGMKHRERASKIGINQHLGKPFNEIELLENINHLLGNSDNSTNTDEYTPA